MYLVCGATVFRNYKTYNLWLYVMQSYSRFPNFEKTSEEVVDTSASVWSTDYGQEAAQPRSQHITAKVTTCGAAVISSLCFENVSTISSLVFSQFRNLE